MSKTMKTTKTTMTERPSFSGNAYTEEAAGIGAQVSKADTVEATNMLLASVTQTVNGLDRSTLQTKASVASHVGNILRHYFTLAEPNYDYGKGEPSMGKLLAAVPPGITTFGDTYLRTCLKLSKGAWSNELHERWEDFSDNADAVASSGKTGHYSGRLQSLADWVTLWHDGKVDRKTGVILAAGSNAKSTPVTVEYVTPDGEDVSITPTTVAELESAKSARSKAQADKLIADVRQSGKIGRLKVETIAGMTDEQLDQMSALVATLKAERREAAQAARVTSQLTAQESALVETLVKHENDVRQTMLAVIDDKRRKLVLLALAAADAASAE